MATPIPAPPPETWLHKTANETKTLIRASLASWAIGATAAVVDKRGVVGGHGFILYIYIDVGGESGGGDSDFLGAKIGLNYPVKFYYQVFSSGRKGWGEGEGRIHTDGFELDWLSLFHRSPTFLLPRLVSNFFNALSGNLVSCWGLLADKVCNKGTWRYIYINGEGFFWLFENYAIVRWDLFCIERGIHIF